MSEFMSSYCERNLKCTKKTMNQKNYRWKKCEARCIGILIDKADFNITT